MKPVVQLGRTGCGIAAVAAMLAAAAAAGAENPRYAEAAKEHSHCAVFYTVAVSVSPKGQEEFKDLALAHARSAVILADRAYYDEQSRLALARLRAELKGDQAAVAATVRKNVEYCRDVLARGHGLLRERVAALQAGDSLDRYVLFLELRRPIEASRAALRKALKAEGYEAYPEGEREVSIALTAAELKKLFDARVVQRTVEKSATHGTTSQSYLEGARIPARFEKLIQRVYFDPQRG
jgi:hypothetical protein